MKLTNDEHSKSGKNTLAIGKPYNKWTVRKTIKRYDQPDKQLYYFLLYPLCKDQVTVRSELLKRYG